MMNSGQIPELLHFRYSPYNEKVRWTLDLKRIKHHRRSLMPGPHLPTVKRRTGQTATPVLHLNGRWLTGSATIIAALDECKPQVPLLPVTDEHRTRALSLQRRFDDDFAPRMRRALLGTMLEHGAYMTTVFAGDKPWPIRVPYRATFPLARPLIAAGNGITGPESIADGLEAANEAFELVAGTAGDAGYLVGGKFSVADLSAACTLATMLEMTGTPMCRPVPRPASIDALCARWAAHPGADWVREMFDRHRGPGQPDNGLISYL